MRVLLATDGSESSNSAVDEVITHPWPEGTEFKVINVVDNSLFAKSDSVAQEQAKKIVEEAVSKIESAIKNASVAGQVLHGSAKVEILECAEIWPSDLLILGSRGLKGLKRALIGSVSHALMLASHCSVRIARGRRVGHDGEFRVLVALDKSEFADYVANVIAARMWPGTTDFLFTTAVPTLAQYIQEAQNSYQTESLDGIRKEEIKEAESNLARITRLLQSRLNSNKINCEILNGDPREAVVERAHDWQADLIITGCRGKNWFNRLIIGSVSEAIATWADCSVEIIKK